jgi:hypothetical protein
MNTPKGLANMVILPSSPYSLSGLLQRGLQGCSRSNGGQKQW